MTPKPLLLSKLQCIRIFAALVLLAGLSTTALSEEDKLSALGRRVAAYKVDPDYPDDALSLMVVQTALAAAKRGSGGIGACLADFRTGRIVETGRNRQYDGYFRSDLHAEMDLLNRYEDRAAKQHTPRSGGSPRDCGDLVLVSSMEPCPMCLTRIINSGIKTVVYVAEDDQGGMAGRLDCLPPFWQAFAADRVFRRARCSPALRDLSLELFNLSTRKFARNRTE